MLQIGPWQLETVSGGEFWLDGGAMFGVVPRPLWEKLHPPDALHRIRMQTNCVLARDGSRTVLIDAGYGGKLSEKERVQLSSEPGEPLLASLHAKGIEPADIDAVVFSHLHFDHCGGASRIASGKVETTFPRARFFVNQHEWEDATSGAAELRASYPSENLAPLEASGRLERIVDGAEIFPGLTALVTGGHTRGHQALCFAAGGATAIYLGDLCPTAAHVRSLWCMAYDLFPLATRGQKPKFLGRIADAGGWALWDHDPSMAAARIVRDAKREFAVSESLVQL